MSLTTTYRNAYTGLSPATWWLSVVMLINRSGTMVIPFMSLYMTQQMHASIGQAGIVMGLFGAGAICGGLLGGKLTDKLGFYNVQVAALLCGGGMFIILGQMRSYLAICICTFLLSVLNDAFRPANSTAIAHYSKPENRTRSYSLNRLAINLGWSLGAGLGGFIASINYSFLFWIDGLTNIFAAVLLLIVLSPRRSDYTPSREDRPVSNSTERNAAYRDKAYIAFVILTIIYAYSFFQMFSMVPLYYNKVLHLSPSFIGAVMSANGIIIALVEMVMVFHLDGKRESLRYITLGSTLMAVSYLVYNILPGQQMLAVIAMLISTCGEMLSMPFMNSFWVSRTNAANRGQYAGLYTIAWSCAQVLGPATGAQVAEHFGFSVLWWYIGGVCLVAAAGYRLLLWRINRSAAAK